MFTYCGGQSALGTRVSHVLATARPHGNSLSSSEVHEPPNQMRQDSCDVYSWERMKHDRNLSEDVHMYSISQHDLVLSLSFRDLVPKLL